VEEGLACSPGDGAGFWEGAEAFEEGDLRGLVWEGPFGGAGLEFVVGLN
jgi:hypothetical protein